MAVLWNPSIPWHKAMLSELQTDRSLGLQLVPVAVDGPGELEGAFAAAGAPMSYGPSFSDTLGRAAVHGDKILGGARPGDLPVEQPTRVELLINLKTARTFGLTISPSVLARADQVIE